jgi:hypothetical protein
MEASTQPSTEGADMNEEIEAMKRRLDQMEGRQLALEVLAAAVLIPGKDDFMGNPVHHLIPGLAEATREKLVHSLASDVKLQAFDDALRQLLSKR